MLNTEPTTEDAAEDELQIGIEENVENHQESEGATEKWSEHGAKVVYAIVYYSNIVSTELEHIFAFFKFYTSQEMLRFHI